MSKPVPPENIAHSAPLGAPSRSKASRRKPSGPAPGFAATLSSAVAARKPRDAAKTARDAALSSRPAEGKRGGAKSAPDSPAVAAETVSKAIRAEGPNTLVAEIRSQDPPAGVAQAKKHGKEIRRREKPATEPRVDTSPPGGAPFESTGTLAAAVASAGRTAAQVVRAQAVVPQESALPSARKPDTPIPVRPRADGPKETVHPSPRADSGNGKTARAETREPQESAGSASAAYHAAETSVSREREGFRPASAEQKVRTRATQEGKGPAPSTAQAHQPAATTGNGTAAPSRMAHVTPPPSIPTPSETDPLSPAVPQGPPAPAPPAGEGKTRGRQATSGKDGQPTASGNEQGPSPRPAPVPGFISRLAETPGPQEAQRTPKGTKQAARRIEETGGDALKRGTAADGAGQPRDDSAAFAVKPRGPDTVPPAAADSPAMGAKVSPSAVPGSPAVAYAPGTPVPATVREASAAKPPETVSPSVPREASPVFQQMAVKVAQLADGAHEVEIRLHPEKLGSLKIDLRIESGRMDATVRAETAEVRSILLREEPSLREALRAGGVTLSSFTVALAGDAWKERRESSRPESGGDSSRRRGRAGEISAVGERPPGESAPAAGAPGHWVA